MVALFAIRSTIYGSILRSDPKIWSLFFLGQILRSPCVRNRFKIRMRIRIELVDTEMADIDSLMTIIQNVPSQIEQAHRSLSSFNVNAIEQWHLRFQNIINLLTVLQEQIQDEGENTFPELSTLCDEALLVYTETENILFGSRQVAVGQQSRV